MNRKVVNSRLDSSRGAYLVIDQSPLIEQFFSLFQSLFCLIFVFIYFILFLFIYLFFFFERLNVGSEREADGMLQRRRPSDLKYENGSLFSDTCGPEPPPEAANGRLGR